MIKLFVFAGFDQFAVLTSSLTWRSCILLTMGWKTFRKQIQSINNHDFVVVLQDPFHFEPDPHWKKMDPGSGN